MDLHKRKFVQKDKNSEAPVFGDLDESVEKKKGANQIQSLLNSLRYHFPHFFFSFCNYTVQKPLQKKPRFSTMLLL